MANQTVVVPMGVNEAYVSVLDQYGNDITGSCTITAASSDPTVIQIGTTDASRPSTIPFTALTTGGKATVQYAATNPMGQVQQTDTLQVEVIAPSSMLVSYKTTLAPTVQPVKK
jgi:hypothetical protein